MLSPLSKTLYMVKDDLHQAGTSFGTCPCDMWRDEQLMAVLYSK